MPGLAAMPPDDPPLGGVTGLGTGGGLPGRGRRVLAGAAVLLAAFLALEAGAQLLVRFLRPPYEWQLVTYRREKAEGVFQPHSFLVGVPRPGARASWRTVEVTHNALGYRGPEASLAKRPGSCRVVCLGGSSTYGVFLDDEETWPAVLGRQLGRAGEVVNLGVPGYTTLEHIVQAATWLPDLQPDVAICYEGWNDARNSHIRDLRGDYGDFHGPHQAVSLGLDSDRPSPFALYRLGRVALTRLNLLPAPPQAKPGPGALTGALDQRALEIYRRNLRSLVTLCRSQGIRVLLVPQRMNEASLRGDAPTPWLPLVRERDVPALIRAYNLVMREVAAETGAAFSERIAQAPFDEADFVDEGHFSPLGAEKFAELLRLELQQLGAPCFSP